MFWYLTVFKSILISPQNIYDLVYQYYSKKFLNYRKCSCNKLGDRYTQMKLKTESLFKILIFKELQKLINSKSIELTVNEFLINTVISTMRFI